MAEPAPVGRTIRSFGDFIFRQFGRLNRQFGKRWVWGNAAQFDSLLEGTGEAVACRFVANAPVDALPLIGADSGLQRGPLETDAQWRLRLQKRWSSWQKGGTDAGIIEQLGVYLGQPASAPEYVVAELEDWLPSPHYYATGTVQVTTGVTDPDGGTGAASVLDTASGTAKEHAVFAVSTPAVPPNTPLVFSITYQAVDCDFARISIDRDAYIWVDMDGAVFVPGGQSGLYSARMVHLGGSWYRVTIRGRTTSTTPQIGVHVSKTGALEYTAVGGDGILLYDPQLSVDWIEVLGAHQIDLESPPDLDNWSRFVVVIPPGLHGWDEAVPPDATVAAPAVVRSMKASCMKSEGIVGVVSGRLAGWPLDGITCDELNDMGFTGGESVARPIPEPVPTWGQIGWFDASEATLVELNGNHVSRLLDKSSAGNHLTQPTAAHQPLYLDRYALHFDADPPTDPVQYLIGNALATSTGGLTILLVMAELDVSGGAHYPISASGGEHIFQLLVGGTTQYLILGTTVQYWDGGPGKQLLEIVLSGDASMVYRNGIAVAGPFTAEHTTLEGDIWIGGRAAFGFHLGRLMELLVYNRALSDGERLAARNYLGSKWL